MRKQMWQGLFLALIALPACFAQPAVTLGLGSVSAVPGGTVSLPVSISSSGGALPTAVQWSFSLPGGLTLLSVDAGSSATSSGKALSCSGNNCVVFGLNTTPIPNGTIASANFQVAANAVGTLLVSLGGVVASDTNSIPASGGSGTISLPAPPPVPALNSLSCGGGSIQTPGSLSCSVTLTSGALNGGFAVALADNHASLAVPASVTVPSGATSASFTVTAAQVTADAAATVTASAGGVSRTANLNLIAAASLASVTCAPASLNSGQATSCAVALTKPAASTTLVTLSSNTAGLPVPASVSIGAGSSSASFNAVAGTIVTNQTATITASFGGVSRTASVNLVAPAPAALSALSCSPSTFSTSGTSVCTVTLTESAAGNTAISIADDSASVTVPASVTVQAGQGSAQFSASVISVPADQSVTITAGLNGATRSAGLTLIAPAALSSVTCAPATLTSGQAASCTATLSKAASASVTVSLSGGGAPITVPASVSIPGGGSSASFTVNAGAIASSQTATVAATLNGITRTASLNLTAPVGLSGLSCSPTAFSAAGSSSCTVSISAPAASSTAIAISDSSANVTTPASVTVPAGQTSAGFSAVVVAVPSNETVTVTAALGGGSQSVALSLTAPAAPASLESLICAPTNLSSNQSAVCSVTLSKASVGTSTVQLSDDSASLAIPANVSLANGATANTFPVTAGVISNSHGVTLTASLNGVTRSTTLNLSAPAPSGISGLFCAPTSFSAAGTSSCTVTLISPVAANTQVAITDNGANVTVPASVTVQAGQTSAAFAANVTGVPADETALITAALNGGSKTVALSLTAPSVLSSVVCSPSTLSGGQTSTCTASLNKAAVDGAVLSVSSSTPFLSGPASVTVPGGAGIAAFSVTAGQIPSGQTATVSVALNGVTRTAAINLVAPTGLSGLSCSPSSFAAAGSATCTVTLAAPAVSAVSVALSDGSVNVTLPGSVTVPSGQSSAQFTAIIGAVTNDETPVIVASLNGGTQSVALTLNAPAVLSSLSCSPSSLGSNQTASCTVSLSKTGTGANIVISDDNATLTSPASVAVPAGAASATFSVTSATVSTNQTVTVSAALNGITRTAAISLTVPETPPVPALSALSCLPASVTAGGSSLCTVAVSPAAVSALPVGVAVNSDALALPASVTIPAAGTSAQFRINVPASASPQSVTLSVSLAGVTKTLTLTITAPDTASGPPQLTSLGCSPSILAPGESSECTLYLREEAVADLFPSISTSSSSLVTPPALTVRAGSKNQSFLVSASEFLSSAQQVDLTVTLSGQTVSTRFALNLGTAVPALTLLECAPGSLTPGATASCEVKLKSAAPFSTELTVSSSHSLLQVPSRVAVTAGAVNATFTVQAGFTDVSQNVTVSAGWSGNTPLSKMVEVKPHTIKVEAPAAVFTRALSRLDFSIGTAHSAGLSTTVSASGLPSGASLQGSRFSWTPGVSDVGEYPVAFRATDAAGLSAAATTRVVVRAEKPTIQGLFNPAGYTPTDSCSPNAMVTFLGSGFSLHDPVAASGTPVPTELAGVRIRINGIYAPITYVSDTTIHFQCPALEAGVRLEVILEYEDVPSLPANAVGAEAIVSAAPVVVLMSGATPGLYQIKGTQAAALIAGTGMIAGLDGGPARPVQPGEYLEIYSNGMGAVSEAMPQGQPAPLDRLIHTLARVTVIFPGGQRVPAMFAGLTPGSVGLFQVNIRVPDGISVGDSVPMYVELLNPDGSTVRSNSATIAVR